jgi:hypothetical protein
MFTVTYKWLFDNCTAPQARTGWTYAQAMTLGVHPHGNKGWLKSLVGQLITEEQKQQFEGLGRAYRVKKGRHVTVYRPSKAADFAATRTPRPTEEQLALPIE